MFSVVIPLYNKSYGIVRAIESILSQDFKVDFEIIIVNDGSTDDSVLKIEKYLKYSNIYLINQKNSGVSVARNVGIKKCKYEFVCFLDADDWWEEVYFSTLNELIVKFPKENFFLMGYQKIRESKNKPIVLGKHTKLFKKFGNNFFNTRALVTPSIAVRKTNLFKVGLFPESISLTEDLYLWSKIICENSVVYTPKIVSNVFYTDDDSRGSRVLIVPYVLQYYAKNKNLIRNLNGFLKYIYLAHIYQSYKLNDYDSWRKRWVIGFKVFPLFSLIFSVMGFILILKKGFLNAGSK
ncbi:glycosyltransferase [Acinetobacter sp.]|uniref:glycosyltransferase n=1 Tax=Acinetobacter sp. TaxID=472 RepID=UPI003C7339C3